MSDDEDATEDMALQVEFCGEWTIVDPERGLTIGREADLVVDENPYLHRHFLQVRWHESMWWLANVGRQLSATISDPEGRFQGWLAPGAHLPVVFEQLMVRFTAGPTTYEVALHLSRAPFAAGSVSDLRSSGDTTLGRVVLTDEQKLLIIALAEPALRPDGTGRSQIPSSAVAAQRLGWPLTKFNRKLDNVCQKLKRAGVRGLHGGPDQLASDRRARLVEYALAVRLVSAADLDVLESQPPAG